ncbi:hypothetical protein [Streptomyces sp. CRB46]|uniref:hypothetical protein n=1 Tax=Streptomyces sp. CRB46 TaxID=2682613 RepID=UPI0018F404CE|nr:hypothetical protein [Streptomyces sp. CRB46]
MSASTMPSIDPPDVCPECAQRESAVRRTKNRLITAGQTVIGAAQAGLAGTGVWLFVEGQSVAAAASAALAGLGFPVIKGLSKLRPQSRE